MTADGRTSRAQWKRLRREVLERDGYRCQRCGKAGRLEIDHIQPVQAGGSDDPENLRALCRGCHIARHRRTVSAVEREWAAYLAGFGAGSGAIDGSD